MSVERKLIITKLNGFLTGEISASEIYEWTLFVAVASDYENLIKNDKLVEQIFQFLMDITKPRSSLVSDKKVLEYFIQCLEDKRKFSQENYQSIILNKPVGAADVSVKPKTRVVVKPATSLGWLVGAAKVYALIFIIISLFLNGVSVMKPDLLVKANEIAPTTGEVWSSALPHLLYGVLILIAMFMKVPKVVFYGFVPVAIWGMFFYWSMATGFVLKYGLSARNILVLLVLMALPPTAAFFVLLNQWFSRLQTLRKK
ncbi:MAG: hypothetical protein H6753_03895 [Candidatus Omnitrophica bacterium]|nr:hypothetical protein [Candidatus Omnitrophota bacterium]